MTYTLLMKIVASAILTASLTIPQKVNSDQFLIMTTEPVIEYPAEVVATSTSPKVIKKSIMKKVIGEKGEDCSEYSSLIGKYEWPATTAMQICRDESHGYAEAKNWNDKHYDRNGDLICISSQGLFAIACFWPDELGYTMEDLLIPEKNVEMAYKIWSMYGFGPWSTYIDLDK